MRPILIYNIKQEAKKMKRFWCAVLALSLVLCCVSSLAEGDFSEKIKFSVSCRNVSASYDWSSDALYSLIANKFNIDMDIWSVDAASQDETGSVWIQGGSMPDAQMWAGFNYSTYVSYVEQELIRALPDGWEQTYPNLYKMVKATGLSDYLNINGKTYGIPHAVFCNFANMDRVVSHVSVYYRADWLKKLGMEPWGATVTIDEFKKYLKGCIDNDLAGNGRTIGLTAKENRLLDYAMMFTGADYDGFNATQNGYVWGPSMPGVTDMIAKLRASYKEGLIDPDFYLLSDTDAMGVFYSGNAAALIYSGSCSGIVQIVDAFKKANPVDDGYSAVSMVTLADSNGVVAAEETTNYWTMTLFNPKTSDKTMARILSMIDWLCTEEGQLTTQLGIEGKDWKRDTDGKLVSLTGQTAISSYPSFYPFNYLSILSDDFSFVSPAFDPRAQEIVSSIYAAKQAGLVVPYNYNYAFYNSDAKRTYSVNIASAAANLILNDADIETEWASFISQNKAMVDPLIAELNAAYPVK